MADLVDISKKLVSMITSVVYPNGTNQPSILGGDTIVQLMDGFPLKYDLDVGLLEGNCVISVFPVNRMERNVTRYGKLWREVSKDAATISLTVTGNKITVSGVPKEDQVCYVKCNYISYFYRILTGDTTESVRQNLASLIPNAFINTDDDVEVSGAFSLKTDVSVSSTVAKETKRQQKVFTISIWTSDYEQRKILGSAIDTYLSDFVRIELPDGWYARLIYDHTADIDSEQEHDLYKREIHYMVEYATVVSLTSSTLTDFEININEE